MAERVKLLRQIQNLGYVTFAGEVSLPPKHSNCNWRRRALTA